MKNIIVCENNTLVYQDNKDVWCELNDETLTVRVEIDIESDDCEMVSVKTLCDLYREHVLNIK